MHDQQLYDILKTIHEERAREVERDRLVVAFLAARPARKPFFAPALAWVGNRLVVLGEYLQERYGKLSSLGSAGGPRQSADHLAPAQHR
jgi:hypothetical protein